jgi:membrane associated rhomboid family serine protease
MAGFGGFRLFPPVIKMLLIVNVSIFILSLMIIPQTAGGYFANNWFMKLFALQPFTLNSFITFGLDGSNAFYPWQLISYQFMHGGFMHLFFNLFALWMFGSELENKWGSSKFLSYYILSGIGAGIVQLIISPLLGPAAPTIGASGAVYGILLAFGLTYPDRKIIMFPLFIPIKAKYFVMIFAGIEMISGITNSGSGIAHFAHLGGALTGYLLLKSGENNPLFNIFNKLFKNPNIFNQQQNKWAIYEQQDKTSYTSKPTFTQSRPNPFEKKYQDYSESEKEAKASGGKVIMIQGEEITQAKIDDILDKISEKGYQNLSQREKDILSELSKRL